MFKASDGVSGVVSRMHRRIDSFTRSTDRISKGLGSVSKTTDKWMGGLTATAGTVAGAGAVAGTALAVAGVGFTKATADAIAFQEDTHRALTLITKDATKAGGIIADALNLSDRLGTGPRDTIQSIQRLMAKGFGEEQALRTFSGLADLKVVIPTANLENAVLAIEQIKSKGVLQMEELQGQLAEAGLNVSSVLESVGKKIGKSQAEVRKLISAGKISADVGIEGILGSIQALTGKELGAAAEGASSGVGGTMKRLAALPERFMTSVAKGLDSGPLKTRMDGIWKSLQPGSAGFEQAVRGASVAFGSFVDLFGAAAQMAPAFRPVVDVVGSLVRETSAWANANKGVIASGLHTFVSESIPVIREFGVGMKDGARDVRGFLSGIGSVIGPLETAFGASSSARIANAHQLGEVVTKAGFAVVGLSVATKVAGGTLVVFEGVTKGVRVSVWAFQGAVAGARAAMVTYQIATKAGAVATLAMSFPLTVTTADFIAQKAASLGAAVGLRGVGASALGARVGLTGMGAAAAGALGPIGLLITAAVMLKDAWEELSRVAGGGKAIWSGVKSALKADEVDAMGNAISSGGFFKGMDEYRNQQAKLDLVKREQAEALAGPGAAPTFDSSLMTAEFAKGMAELNKFTEQIEAMQVSGTLPLGPDPAPRPDPEVSTPAERSAQAIRQELRETRHVEEQRSVLIVRAEPGTSAELEKPSRGSRIKVESSGAD